MGVGTVLAEAPPVETRAVAGLAAPAEIRIDRWGISHIYADSVRDAFFLQGYNVARDRLWQVDLWRKRGLGLLAEDFGPAYAEQDRAARLFLYRGDMETEWAAYGPNAKGYAEAFVAGLNAYMAEIIAGDRTLPAEFALTGTTPDLWQAEDVVRIRSHGLTRNAAAEVERAQITCAAGLGANALNRKLEPASTPAPFPPTSWPTIAWGPTPSGSRPGASSRPPPMCRQTPSAPTTGPSRPRAPPPAGRSWPMTRTGPTGRRRCATSSTLRRPASR
jgi:penicillin amidase